MNLRQQLETIQWEGPARVAALVEKPGPGIHALCSRVEVIEGHGFSGDHPRKSWWKGALVPGRDVTAMALEVLEVLGCAPEVPGDNLITEGVDLRDLREGDLLEIGSTRLRRSAREHKPCATFAGRTSDTAMETIRATSMRGALFTVEKGGTINLGDSIRVRRAADVVAESLTSSPIIPHA